MHGHQNHSFHHYITSHISVLDAPFLPSAPLSIQSIGNHPPKYERAKNETNAANGEASTGTSDTLLVVAEMSTTPRREGTQDHLQHSRGSSPTHHYQPHPSYPLDDDLAGNLRDRLSRPLGCLGLGLSVCHRVSSSAARLPST